MPSRSTFAGSRTDSAEERRDGSTARSPALATKRGRGRVVGCRSCTRALKLDDVTSPPGADRTPSKEMIRNVPETQWDRLHAMLRAPLEFVCNKSASRRHADFEAVLIPFRRCGTFRPIVDAEDALDAVFAVKTNIF
jgi:hypothetical protein